MSPVSWISRVWALAIALGLTGASCATQKSTTLIKDRALLHEQQAQTSTSKEPGNATQTKIQVTYTYNNAHSCDLLIGGLTRSRSADARQCVLSHLGHHERQHDIEVIQ